MSRRSEAEPGWGYAQVPMPRRASTIVAGLVLAGGCAATPARPTSFKSDDPERQLSVVEACDVVAEPRARQGANPDRAIWSARLSCVGGTGGGRGGGIDMVRIRFGAELIVNGIGRGRVVPWPKHHLLESGQSKWICAEDGLNPPFDGCWWPLDGRWSPGQPWSVKVYWKWCLASRPACPGYPFDADAEPATVTPASESSQP